MQTVQFYPQWVWDSRCNLFPPSQGKSCYPYLRNKHISKLFQRKNGRRVSLFLYLASVINFCLHWIVRLCSIIQSKHYLVHWLPNCIMHTPFPDHLQCGLLTCIISSGVNISKTGPSYLGKLDWFIFTFCGAGVWTQGLVIARQALCCWGTALFPT